MNIIRAYKIYSSGINIPDKQKEMFEYLDDKFDGLKIFRVEPLDFVKNHLLYINSKNECIFEVIFDRIYICYNIIWDDLTVKFSLSLFNKEEILKFLITKKYGLNIKCLETKVVPTSLNVKLLIEDSLKSRFKK